jgi:transposase-like protein
MNHPTKHLRKIPHHCDETKFFSTVSSRGKKRIKVSDPRTDGKRIDYRLKSNKELAVYKNVVIRCRTSGTSYHKIARAFRLSSKTVYEWVKQTGHFVNPLNSMDWYVFKTKPLHVNIQAVADALLSNILACRNGWIAEINIDNILAGISIH